MTESRISDTKIALVTGGSRGLGRSTVAALARKGTDSILTYHSRRDEAEAAVAEITALGRKAVALRLDTGDVASFPAFGDAVREALRTTWSRERFDHLVNNAGLGAASPFLEARESDFDLLVNVHLKGVYFLTQRLVPLMADGGRIINLSSGLARYSLPGMSAYAMMKGGIEVFTRYLAKELGPRRITANTVAPGAIETDFGGGRVREPEYNRRVADMTALGRAGVPEDIGPLIAALLTEDTRWVNGQRIEASGGANL